MSDGSKIEWLARPDTKPATWNPVSGCSKVSEGCIHCYAERMSKRLAGRFGYPKDEPFKVTLHPDRLEQPLHWRKPRTVFVVSMGDLFHEDVPFEYIRRVWSVMEQRPKHTFIVLTKRPFKMLESVRDHFAWESPDGEQGIDVPDNIWLGVTAENQKRADERIPVLLQCPATVRFVSIEPMLGSILFRRWMSPSVDWPDCGIHWVIVGGESGPSARPMHPDWVRGVRDQCQAAGVPWFLKQWGAWMPVEQYGMVYLPGRDDAIKQMTVPRDDAQAVMVRVGKARVGHLLDGQEWRQWPT